MNILITLSYYLPNISGLTIYVKTLAEELSKSGNSVTVLTSGHSKETEVDAKRSKVKVVKVWTPFKFGRGPIMPTYFANSFFQVLKSEAVICQLPQFESIAIAFWAKVLRRKLIITYHCDLSFWPGFINKITVFSSYVSHFITCLLAERIVVNSKDYADNSPFLKLFKKKLVYIYPPVKLGIREENITFGKNNLKFKVGFVGRLAKEKGLKYLLETIGYLQDMLDGRVGIYLVGPGEEVIGGNFQDEIAKLLASFSDRVFLLGTLNEGQLKKFYKMVDVLVLPSVERMESFGMTQVEAMLSGCPVVVNDLPGARIPVRLTGMGEIVDVKNPRKFAKAVVEVIKNRNRYKKLESKASKIFDYRTSIDKYEELLGTLS